MVIMWIGIYVVQWWRIYSYIQTKLVDLWGKQNDKQRYCECDNCMLMHSHICWKVCQIHVIFDDQANVKEMVFIIMAKSMWVQEGSCE